MPVTQIGPGQAQDVFSHDFELDAGATDSPAYMEFEYDGNLVVKATSWTSRSREVIQYVQEVTYQQGNLVERITTTFYDFESGEPAVVAVQIPEYDQRKRVVAIERTVEHVT